MEVMPFDALAEQEPLISIPTLASERQGARPEWHSVVPTLIHQTTRLRELRLSDALPLLSMLTT
ncbi:MAG TPA: hypothetical protein VHJ58_11150, partial [Vicinamibacterales bacterium]|nr:hypothetical protein [Vicinamibacterales bacterium]